MHVVCWTAAYRHIRDYQSMPSRRTAVYGSQLIQVRAGIPTVELTAATAERVALASDVQAAGSPSSTTAASAQILDEDGKPIATKQLSCAAARDCDSTTGGMALGAAGMVAFFGS